MMQKPNLNEFERKLSDAADLASDLFTAMLGFDAALTLLADDRVLGLIPPVRPGHIVPGGLLTHKGSEHGHQYHFTHYLRRVRQEPGKTATSRVWASAALARFGEELKRNDYFGRPPYLELVRHLRNAVAHGDQFIILHPQKLKDFPAFLEAGFCRWGITPELNGTSLYDYLSIGDVASIISLSGIQLRNRALKRHVS